MNIHKDKFDYSLTIYNRAAVGINKHSFMYFKSYAYLHKAKMPDFYVLIHVCDIFGIKS